MQTGTRDIFLRLTVDVRYEDTIRNEPKVERLKDVLLEAVDYLASNGLLSGETDATVAQWDAQVEEIV